MQPSRRLVIEDADHPDWRARYAMWFSVLGAAAVTKSEKQKARSEARIAWLTQPSIPTDFLVPAELYVVAA